MKTEDLIAMAAHQAAQNAQQSSHSAPSRVDMAAAEMMGMLVGQTTPPQQLNQPLEPGQVPSFQGQPSGANNAMHAPVPPTGFAAQPQAAPAGAMPHSAPAMTTPQMPSPAPKMAPPAPQMPSPSAPPSALQPAKLDSTGHVPPAARAEQAAQQLGTPTGELGSPAAVENQNWHETVPVENKSIARKGLIFIFGFLAIFFAWAVLFPISSAVVAPGSIVSLGANKLLQHPVGGVVSELLVTEGERVEKDQIILELDPAASQAEVSRLDARVRMLNAQRTRLDSELGQGDFNKTGESSGSQLRGTQTTDAEATKTSTEPPKDPLLVEQLREFEAGRKRLEAELDAAASLVEAGKDDRAGFETQLAGAKELLAFTLGEIKKVKPLADDGYLPKSRLWDLEKTRLEQVTQIGNLEASIDASTQRIAEATARFAQIKETAEEQRSESSTQVLAELAELQDSLNAAKVALSSTQIRAPVSGVITKMIANTEGGVIRAGETIAEIVPADSDLVTEFRVPLHKVKAVKVGQEARVVVAAFNRRTYEPIMAEVIYVSADSDMDETTAETFYLARARLKFDPEKTQGINEIQAGMPTEVYALSEPRVFLDYVLQPIFDSFDKAFREVN